MSYPSRGIHSPKCEAFKMTSPTENKPSAVDSLKDKAANLVHKVTSKSHSHGETTTMAEQPLAYNNKHGKVNPRYSVHLLDERANADKIAEANAIEHFQHTTDASDVNPVYSHEHTSITGQQHLHEHHHKKEYEYGYCHKIDDPQHDITLRLVDERGDPNNLGSIHLKPTM